jgi:hypothetical protein
MDDLQGSAGRQASPGRTTSCIRFATVQLKAIPDRGTPFVHIEAAAGGNHPRTRSLDGALTSTNRCLTCTDEVSDRRRAQQRPERSKIRIHAASNAGHHAATDGLLFKLRRARIQDAEGDHDPLELIT